MCKNSFNEILTARHMGPKKEHKMVKHPSPFYALFRFILCLSAAFVFRLIRYMVPTMPLHAKFLIKLLCLMIPTDAI